MAKEGRILISAPETVNPRRQFPDGGQRILPAVTERIRSYPIDRVGKSGVKADVDRVTVEEPLEIRVGGQTLAVTMRTPGHDFALGAGFLVAEGVVSRAEEILRIEHCREVRSPDEEGGAQFNVSSGADRLGSSSAPRGPEETTRGAPPRG